MEKKCGKIGTMEWINNNCWLAKNLAYSPTKHCCYCQNNLRSCIFFRYFLISIFFLFFLLFFSFSFKIEIQKIIFPFIFLIIIYSYFFNKSTEKIIETSFLERKNKEILEEMNAVLEIRVAARTKQLKEITEDLKRKVKEKTQNLCRKVLELERFKKLSIDRELKMIELKKEIKNLRKEIRKIGKKKAQI